MAKKCIPGVICIENMTFVLMIIVLVIFSYILYITQKMNSASTKNTSQSIYDSKYVSNIPSNVIVSTTGETIGGASTRNSPGYYINPYGPPQRQDDMFFRRDSTDIRGGIPINVETRGSPGAYYQVGILTNKESHDPLILTLMARRLTNGRDKWQYYTISNTGNMNTKLPVNVNGKNCSSEYGCDEIQSGDNVFVQGYDKSFKTTIYENSLFSYIPFI
jgi:hypothetical protein